jgi:signal transduction histidine kinase
MGGKERTGPLVLYVDDDRTNRIVFAQSLGEFNVQTAPDGKIALELMAQIEVAVLVTDMRMPGMSGEELLRIAKERHPQTIRMVVTAYSDIEPILRAINEGLVARYILKPWDRSELMQVLRWACELWTFGRDSAELHRRLLETERLVTLGSIAGMLVHDLKQPLMSLIVNIESLREMGKAAPVIVRALEEAELPYVTRDRLIAQINDLDGLATDLRASADHLNEMINGLRELGRPRDNVHGPSSIDPLPVVRHAISVCQELAIRGRASIDYDGPKQLPHVRMSATELTQVLINVVSNGAQAVAARGVPNGRVRIRAREDGDGTLELQIQDDGVGMPPEVLERAGTPFFTTRAEGTGLGLAQCQRLVGTAGGRFRIESKQGIGTTVTIILPTAA